MYVAGWQFSSRPMAATNPIFSAISVETLTMNHNLAWPWSDKSSPPQTPFLSFSSPSCETLLFDEGETIKIRCQAGLRSVGLGWTLHRNGIQKPFRRGTAESHAANRFFISLATAGLQPGFYDLRVELDTGAQSTSKAALEARPAQGVCTFGWQVDRLPLADTRPADFAAFWAAAKGKLAAVPLAAREGQMERFDDAAINAYNLGSACLPADYDPSGHRSASVLSGKVDFGGPDGGRIYGWLAKPAGEGPFPAMLVLPGAGFAARAWRRHGSLHGLL